MTTTFIKIYGLERSGTNYSEWLLSNNFDRVRVLVDELGWKHGPIPDSVDWTGGNWTDPDWTEAERVPYLRRRRAGLQAQAADVQAAIDRGELCFYFVCKNPYSWYLSYCRYKWLHPLPIRPEFLRRWSSVNAHWWDFHSVDASRTVFVRHEDLLGDLDGSLQTIERQLRLERTGTEVSRTTRRMSDNGNPGDRDFDAGYYRDQRYLDDYRPSDLDTISGIVDADLMRTLGYRLRTEDLGPERSWPGPIRLRR